MARPQKLTDLDVLERTTALFWKHGCDKVSTRDIETALDLRAPAIYRRFKSKDALLAQSIDYYVARVVERRVARLLDGNPDPLDALHRFFREMLIPHPDTEGLRGCLLTNVAAHRKACAPEVGAAVNRGFDVIRLAFRTQVERAVGSKQVPADTDAEALATALFMSLQGLLLLARAGAPDLDNGIEATFRLLRAPGNHAA